MITSPDTLNDPGLGGGFQVGQVIKSMGGGSTAHLCGGLQLNADGGAVGMAEELTQTGIG